MWGRIALLCIAGASCVLEGIPRQALAATITIVNADPPSVGFNDPTPATPVGGNPGTTVGAQRLNAVQRAADIWGSIVESDVPILVRATWSSLDCSPSFGFLGFCGPSGTFSDTPGVQYAHTWYPVALANEMAGMDLDPANADMQLQLNSAVGSAECLTNFTWYYGLDNQALDDEFDLVTTALHEIAHGLGSLDFVDESTGQLLGGQIDVYSRFVFDNVTGKRWDELTDGERAVSARNHGHLVWDGPAVTQAAAGILDDRPIVEITDPVAIAGVYETSVADFGPRLTLGGFAGAVALVEDGVGVGSDACDPILNAVELGGKIALIDRGSCPFVFKAKAAQDAGAIAAVIVNNVPGNKVTGMGGSDPTLTIPTVMVSLETGFAIKQELQSGVLMSLRLDPDHRAGADDAGRVLLYAPDPVEPASSVAHWDLSATPDLLMEPLIPSAIPQNGDLTVKVFKDLGWPLIVPITLENLSARSEVNAIVVTWTFGAAALHDLAGVAVERSSAPAGPYARCTPTLLLPAKEMSYEDRDVAATGAYWYRLVLVDMLGNVERSRSVQVTAVPGPESAALVIPVCAATRAPVEIRYRLAQTRAGVRLDIYDVAGRHLRTLPQGSQNPGPHRTQWDRLDAHGNPVGRGIYVVRLVAGEWAVAGKAVVLGR